MSKHFKNYLEIFMSRMVSFPTDKKIRNKTIFYKKPLGLMISAHF